MQKGIHPHRLTQEKGRRHEGADKKGLEITQIHLQDGLAKGESDDDEVEFF